MPVDVLTTCANTEWNDIKLHGESRDDHELGLHSIATYVDFAERFGLAN